MGVLADAVLGAGGEVIGVIPRALATKEIAHQGLADLRIVPSMHERKALMTELADGFIALPGGYGTFDELFEGLVTKFDLVITFLAILELLKESLIEVVQADEFGPIHVRAASAGGKVELPKPTSDAVEEEET